MFCIINLSALVKYFEQARKKRIGKAAAMKSKKATTTESISNADLEGQLMVSIFVP